MASAESVEYQSVGKKCSVQVQYSTDAFVNEGECNLKMDFF